MVSTADRVAGQCGPSAALGIPNLRRVYGRAEVVEGGARNAGSGQHLAGGEDCEVVVPACETHWRRPLPCGGGLVEVEDLGRVGCQPATGIQDLPVIIHHRGAVVALAEQPDRPGDPLTRARD